MEENPDTNWRAMFDRGRDGRQLSGQAHTHPPNRHIEPPAALDDGHHASDPINPSLTPREITDQAAMALADDPQEYRPWILQRGRTRPAMMLHLRRFDARAGHWLGWSIAYPSLVAVEYVGDSLLSLDFGLRHFVLEGQGLGSLIDPMQASSVLCIQEFTPHVWPLAQDSSIITAIKVLHNEIHKW